MVVLLYINRLMHFGWIGGVQAFADLFRQSGGQLFVRPDDAGQRLNGHQVGVRGGLDRSSCAENPYHNQYIEFPTLHSSKKLFTFYIYTHRKSNPTLRDLTPF